MENKEIGISCLEKFIKNQQNIDIFNKKLEEKSSTTDEYFQNLYSTCYSLQKIKSLSVNRLEQIKNILSNIKEGKLGWESSVFIDSRNRITEQDEFLTNPFTVEEGVLECNKCGSKKTFSYTKQIRRADEGTTVFCVCVKCNAKWKIN